jgi:hypothetical protein
MTTGYANAEANAQGWYDSIVEMVAELNAANEGDADGDIDDGRLDSARDRITESVLSVEVRPGWYSMGGDTQDRKPEEYRILLSTGGPALQLWGTLDEHGEPETA